ncbi:helix-turn-helix domain-containing protein [Aneurinibacillus migulanus]|uniref:Cro/Cl family transcriptional regulator n=1 Tax=Aneurinibacillus migulanus TaxID=47500 RepID=A0A0D1XZF1_ANEMI|nr:helix-turn-helix transcriptional regulator [Aneurinibacillus migulanus]KIV57443.1 Cro/Cl family transcriptional regulator [Aneurinibacillus migulanus]KON94946.1 Cro/Cl family transcriptional regulator [Aneurinibacillus migulanus]MED0892766.1 helix-turn-helix transcriptional regulator [Aneurinibacillus migulanus]MED1619012.1 helix-turn-helix transcriptional regulator [Aneurinibacillus migulanus]GED14414.1 hypothetical protein AMI01nite_24050 [Aneurinibacillus migulanus]
MAKRVVIKIEEISKNHGNLSLSELSDLTGVRRATLSELTNGKRKRIEFSHIERIAEALKIEDIREIIDFIDSHERN